MVAKGSHCSSHLWMLVALVVLCTTPSNAFVSSTRRMGIPRTTTKAGRIINSSINSQKVDELEATTTIAEAVAESTNIESPLSVVQPMEDQTLLLQDSQDASVYQKGLVTIGFITLLFASNSPALHAAYVDVAKTPPVFLLNAGVSLVALLAIGIGGPWLNQAVEAPSLLETNSKNSNPVLQMMFGSNVDAAVLGGLELGLWKFCGTLANLYGLSLTSAGHGAFLIQLTTLFVPLAQGIMGVPIPRRIWSAIALALMGVALFTQDTGAAGSGFTWQGDLACALAAVFYATYDLRLFHWGKRVEPLQLITTKIVSQTALSVLALVALAWNETVDFWTTCNSHDLILVGLVTLWSGLAVNTVAPYLQVGGQQAVGPARAQILYASQPLWAAGMSYVALGEQVGPLGLVGGTAFLAAMALAATAEVPNPDCDNDICEV